MELTYLEIQDFLDCIAEDSYEESLFQIKIHGGKPANLLRRKSRRESQIEKNKLQKIENSNSNKLANKWFDEMKEGKWRTTQQ